MATMIKFFGNSRCGCIGCRHGVTGPAARSAFKSLRNKHGNIYGRNPHEGKKDTKKGNTATAKAL